MGIFPPTHFYRPHAFPVAQPPVSEPWSSKHKLNTRINHQLASSDIAWTCDSWKNRHCSLSVSLESTSCFSPTASCRSFYLGLWSSYAAHVSSALSINSPFSSSITPSLFHSRLKTYLFHKSSPVGPLSLGLTQWTLAAHRFICTPGYVLVLCSILSWFLRAFDHTLISHYHHHYQGPQVLSHHSHLTLPSLAQNNWKHRIQDPIAYTQSPDHCLTFLSVSPHHRPASLQHPLLICGHSFPSTFIVIFTNNLSVFSLCLTSSL